MDFDNPFMLKSIYKGPPDAERDAAWRALHDPGAEKGIKIPAERLHFLNRSDDGGNSLKQSPPERGGGYFALVEVFHHLHCLDIIRQYTWRDYYLRHADDLATPPSLQDTPVGSRLHVDHCIEALRQTLICHGDVTPFLILIDPAASGGTRADFSAHHRCRAFEPLREYMRENAFLP